MERESTSYPYTVIMLILKSAVNKRVYTSELCLDFITKPSEPYGNLATYQRPATRNLSIPLGNRIGDGNRIGEGAGEHPQRGRNQDALGEGENRRGATFKAKAR